MIDYLELQIIDDLAPVEHIGLPDAEGSRVFQRARALKQKLDEANDKLFRMLQASIRSSDRSVLKRYLTHTEQQTPSRVDEDYVGYDEVDILISGLMEADSAPEGPRTLAPDMVFYQPTPTRVILKLLDELCLSPRDVLYDLGSGLGHVPILVNLLADIQTKGIEIDESYYRYSASCLKNLNLPGVEFVHADARDASYDDGTVFYLYTPFLGEMLEQVLRKLEAQSEQRPIRVCTYGPVTFQVSKQHWLEPRYQAGSEEGSLGIFASM